MGFPAPEAEYEARVRASFARQTVMVTIGARMTRVEPGAVEITLPFRADLSQQDGYVHAGIIATILDSACGYSAYSLMPIDALPLTVEYKINLLRPAVGERFVARGHVVKPGRTLTVCTGDVFAVVGNSEKAVATMVGTIMNVK